MAERKQMFSDSWHRVAPERVRLNPAVEVTKQVFRGQRWYLLRDPLNNEFYRVSPAAYSFVGRLRGNRTVDEVWRDCLALHPDDAPGQEEAIQVLSQLHRANLLQSQLAPDSRQLFERQRKTKSRKARGQMVNFLFLNIPLFDPNQFLDLIRPMMRLFLNPLGFMVWLGVVGAGIWTATGHLDALADESAGVLAPTNLFYLYLCTIFIKVIHEFGHAVMCKHFGGEVHTAGVMLMLMTPLPYVDATSSWSFRKRWKRVAVDAAGMGSEFFVASLALFVWLSTSDPLISRLAYNVIFIASVSTVLFNANPLLRFDGYYLFSDLFDLPNLYQRATRQLKHLSERYLLGVRASFSPADSDVEAFWLTVYGVSAFIYRILLLVFITYHVAQGFLGLGLAIAGFCVVLYFIAPLVKFVKYLITSNSLDRVRPRALAVTGFLITSLVVIVGLIPLPRSFRAAGMLKAEREEVVYGNASGFVDEVLVPTTRVVEKGTPLIRLVNPELDQDIESAQSRLEQMGIQIEEARQSGFSTIVGPLIQQAEAGRLFLNELAAQRDDLLILSPIAGIWSSPRSRELVGTWSPRGTEVGRVIDPAEFIFLSAVPQKESGNLFNGQIVKSEVRLEGQADRSLKVVEQTVVPGGQEELPTAALGWLAGGQIQLKQGDQTGTKAAENFYLVRSRLTSDNKDVTLLPSLTGQIRFSLPPEPLKDQWMRMARQLFQGRARQ